MSRWRRPLPILLVGVVPWTVVVYPGGVVTYFATGILANNLAFVPLPTYLANAALAVLPDRLLAWPAGVVLWVVALFSAALGRYEDRRVTVGLLAFAGVSQSVFAVGFWTAEGYVTVPVGGVLLLWLAWEYRRSGRSMVAPEAGSE